MTTKNELSAIAPAELTNVTGGATDTKLTAMLTQITDALKDVSQPKTSSMDQMMPMIMMMMMGGGGGGSGGAAAAAPPPPPSNIIRVNVRR